MAENDGQSEIHSVEPETTTTERASDNSSEADAASLEKRPRRSARRDKNRPHVMRHGMLSKYPLEALASLGEDKKKLRRIERMFGPNCGLRAW